MYANEESQTPHELELEGDDEEDRMIVQPASHRGSPAVKNQKKDTRKQKERRIVFNVVSKSPSPTPPTTSRYEIQRCAKSR